MRLLLTRLSSLGDVVHTWPLVRALSRLHPRPHLTWLVEEEYLPLVAPNPAVDRAIPVATRRWRRRPWRATTGQELGATVRALRALRPEVALDPQGLFKSAVWGALAGAPRRVGLAPEVRREAAAGLFYTETSPSPGLPCHAVDVALSLLAGLGLDVPWGAVPDGSFLAGPGAHPDLGVRSGPVLLVPAAGRSAKIWDTASFAEVARRLAASGMEVEVLWGPGEQHLAALIAAIAGVRCAPPTPLSMLPQYFLGARGVVGGDTGPVHLAAALGVPTVMLHLATDPRRSGARGRRAVVFDGRPGSGSPLSPERVAAVAITAFSRSGVEWPDLERRGGALEW